MQKEGTTDISMSTTAKRLLMLVPLFVLIFVLSVSFAEAQVSCYTFDGTNESGCEAAYGGSVCGWEGEPNNFCDPIGCWDFSSNVTCTAAAGAGLPCAWSEDDHNPGNYFCEEPGCWTFDGDHAACVNASLGLNCEWYAGESICDPAHVVCGDYDNQESNCLDTFSCIWDPGSSLCTDGGMGPGGFTAGCGMFPVQGLCENVTGCSWNGEYCTGPTEGLGCTEVLDSDMCGKIPMFSTCCAWSGGSSGVCNTTFSTSCWDNMPEPIPGANFCEDWAAIGNQTVCNMISGEPWYMPCKWDNRSTTTTDDDRCEFNGDNFFDGGPNSGHFEDIGSKSTCEAAGGIWMTETYVDQSGNTQQAQWCEMQFGIGTESCDSSCWACEFQPDGSDWADEAAAGVACEASQLGFCSWRNKTGFENALNGKGFCEKPHELAFAGCGIETSCQDYEFYTNPQASCDADDDCKWLTDPQDPTIGWCGGANAKTCAQSCGQCLTQTTCFNNGTSCDWDTNNQFCYTQSSGGDTAEICFDGVDNDGDGMTDCADSGCISDPFCGGGMGFNCFQFNDNPSCVNSSNGECSWINDPYNNESWCDVKGANCWIHDDSNVTCAAETGCSWSTSFFGDSTCDVNEDLFDTCFQFDHQNNVTCNADGNCTFKYFPPGSPPGPGGMNGFCEPKPFTCWNSYFDDQTGCTADPFCGWINDSYMPAGGRCEGLCWTANSSQCGTGAWSFCEERAGWCEPEGFMGGGCWQNDGNQTACEAKDKCLWQPDTFYVGPGDAGWCNDAFMMTQFQGMESGPPVILSTDASGCSTGSADQDLPDNVDICGVGVKDMENSFGFGIQVDSLASSIMCNGKPLMQGGSGSGTLPGTYYLYLDSDGDSTGGCNDTEDNETGFEFYFKYGTTDDGGSLSESKIAYRCNNGTWGTAPIPFDTWPEKSCQEIGAPIIAINKGTLESYSDFNRSANLRVYALASNSSNVSIIQDSVPAGYYLQGSVDFVPEDCRGIIDMDGDGCLPAEDPDCMVFNQFGFIPFEDCWNGLDDNFDGNVDCDDPMCKYDTFACPGGGGLVADPNDKTPPSLAWFEMRAMPDHAFVSIDTFEPSNASLFFYRNDTTCVTLNSTVVDDRYLSWHDLPIDNFPFNPQGIGFDLSSNSTYWYKYSLCDISGNCLVSACRNFTTEVSYSACGRQCNTYLDPFDFTPPNGSVPTDPLGYLEINYDLDGDGSYELNKSYGDSSTQTNLNETRNVNIKIGNPNSTEPWAIECINGSIPSTISFNSSNINVNETAGNGAVGMPTDEYTNKFIADFACTRIRITLPFPGTTLYNCRAVDNATDPETECIDVTNNATLISSDGTSSTWEVDPAIIGFSYYVGAGGDVYNVTFLNTTASSVTTTSGAVGNYNITIVNNENVNRAYNLTVGFLTGSGTAAINNTVANLTGLANVTVSVNISSTVGGTYTWQLVGTLHNDSSGSLNSTDDIGAFTYITTDSTKPAPITGLTNASRTNTSLYWTWTPPVDSDFNNTLVNVTLSGSTVNYTSIAAGTNGYNATGLSNATDYAIIVQTKDGSGNINTTLVTTTWTTLQHPYPPVATVISPNGGENLSGSFVLNVSVTDRDGNSTITQVDFWISGNGGTSWTNVGTDVDTTDIYYSVTYTSTAGADSATYLFRANATDPVYVGVDSSDAVFRVDNTAPTWNETPASQSVSYASALRYDLNASDGFKIGDYYVNDTTNFVIDDLTGLLENNSLLGMGVYSITVSVNDSLGNVNSTIISITVTDDVLPTWNETPANQIMEYATSFAVDFNASDNLAVGEYFIDVTTNFVIDGTTGVLSNSSTPAPNIYAVNVSVNDSQGNTISRLINITVQNTVAPSTITGLTNASRTNTTLYWTWTNPTEIDFNNTFVNITLAGVTQTYVALGSGVAAYNLTSLQNATAYGIYITTQDNASNVNSNLVYTTWTTLQRPYPPVTAVVYPDGGENLTGSAATVNATSTDVDGNTTISQVQFYYSTNGGTTWTIIGTDTNNSDVYYSTTWDTSGVSDGSAYQLLANASDPIYTTTDSSTANFTIDNTAPSATSATVSVESAAVYTTNATLEFTWTGFSDPTTGIRYYYYNTTNYASTTNGTRVSNGTAAGSILMSSDGTHTVFVWGADHAGNIGLAASDSIILDTAAPTITLVYPAASGNINDTTPNVQFTILEAGIGLDISTVTVLLNTTSYVWDNLSCTLVSSTYTCNITLPAALDLADNLLNISASDNLSQPAHADTVFTINVAPPSYDQSTTAATAGTVTSSNAGPYTFNSTATAISANVTSTNSGYFLINDTDVNATVLGSAITLVGSESNATVTFAAVTLSGAKANATSTYGAMSFNATGINATVTNGTAVTLVGAASNATATNGALSFNATGINATMLGGAVSLTGGAANATNTTMSALAFVSSAINASLQGSAVSITGAAANATNTYGALSFNATGINASLNGSAVTLTGSGANASRNHGALSFNSSGINATMQGSAIPSILSGAAANASNNYGGLSFNSSAQNATWPGSTVTLSGASVNATNNYGGLSFNSSAQNATWPGAAVTLVGPAVNATNTSYGAVGFVSAAVNATLTGSAVTLAGIAVAASNFSDSVSSNNTYSAANTGAAGNLINISIVNETGNNRFNVTIVNGTVKESYVYYNESGGLNITTFQHIVWAISGTVNSSVSTLVTAALVDADGSPIPINLTFAGGFDANGYLADGNFSINGVLINWTTNTSATSANAAATQIIGRINMNTTESNVSATGDGSGIILTNIFQSLEDSIIITGAGSQSGFTDGTTANGGAAGSYLAAGDLVINGINMTWVTNYSQTTVAGAASFFVYLMNVNTSDHNITAAGDENGLTLTQNYNGVQFTIDVTEGNAQANITVANTANGQAAYLDAGHVVINGINSTWAAATGTITTAAAATSIMAAINANGTNTSVFAAGGSAGIALEANVSAIAYIVNVSYADSQSGMSTGVNTSGRAVNTYLGAGGFTMNGVAFSWTRNISMIILADAADYFQALINSPSSQTNVTALVGPGGVNLTQNNTGVQFTIDITEADDQTNLTVATISNGQAAYLSAGHVVINGINSTWAAATGTITTAAAATSIMAAINANGTNTSVFAVGDQTGIDLEANVSAIAYIINVSYANGQSGMGTGVNTSGRAVNTYLGAGGFTMNGVAFSWVRNISIITPVAQATFFQTFINSPSGQTNVTALVGPGGINLTQNNTGVQFTIDITEADDQTNLTVATISNGQAPYLYSGSVTINGRTLSWGNQTTNLTATIAAVTIVATINANTSDTNVSAVGAAEGINLTNIYQEITDVIAITSPDTQSGLSITTANNGRATNSYRGAGGFTLNGIAFAWAANTSQTAIADMASYFVYHLNANTSKTNVSALGSDAGLNLTNIYQGIQFIINVTEADDQSNLTAGTSSSGQALYLDAGTVTINGIASSWVADTNNITTTQAAVTIIAAINANTSVSNVSAVGDNNSINLTNIYQEITDVIAITSPDAQSGLSVTTATNGRATNSYRGAGGFTLNGFAFTWTADTSVTSLSSFATYIIGLMNANTTETNVTASGSDTGLTLTQNETGSQFTIAITEADDQTNLTAGTISNGQAPYLGSGSVTINGRVLSWGNATANLTTAQATVTLIAAINANTSDTNVSAVGAAAGINLTNNQQEITDVIAITSPDTQSGLSTTTATNGRAANSYLGAGDFVINGFTFSWTANTSMLTLPDWAEYVVALINLNTSDTNVSAVGTEARINLTQTQTGSQFVINISNADTQSGLPVSVTSTGQASYLGGGTVTINGVVSTWASNVSTLTAAVGVNQIVNAINANTSVSNVSAVGAAAGINLTNNQQAIADVIAVTSPNAQSGLSATTASNGLAATEYRGAGAFTLNGVAFAWAANTSQTVLADMASYFVYHLNANTSKTNVTATGSATGITLTQIYEGAGFQIDIIEADDQSNLTVSTATNGQAAYLMGGSVLINSINSSWADATGTVTAAAAATSIVAAINANTSASDVSAVGSAAGINLTNTLQEIANVIAVSSPDSQSGLSVGTATNGRSATEYRGAGGFTLNGVAFAWAANTSQIALGELASYVVYHLNANTSKTNVTATGSATGLTLTQIYEGSQFTIAITEDDDQSNLTVSTATNGQAAYLDVGDLVLNDVNITWAADTNNVTANAATTTIIAAINVNTSQHSLIATGDGSGIILTRNTPSLTDTINVTYGDSQANITTGFTSNGQAAYLANGHVVINDANATWADSTGTITAAAAATIIVNAINADNGTSGVLSVGSAAGINLTQKTPDSVINISSLGTVQSGLSTGYTDNGVARNNVLYFSTDSGGVQTITLTGGNLSAQSISLQINGSIANGTAFNVSGNVVIQSLSTGNSSKVQMVSIANNAYTVIGFDLAEHNGTNSVNALNVFNFTINGQAVSVSFTPTGTALDEENVSAQINIQFPGLASNSSNMVLLTNPETGTNSTIVIGTGTANGVLGFTAGVQANGTNLTYDQFGVTPTTVVSGSYIYAYANWTDDTSIDTVWLMKNTSSTALNVTRVGSGVNYFANLSYLVTDAEVGTLYLLLHANDTNGNHNMTSILTVTVTDGLAPVLGIISPEAGNRINASVGSYSFSWYATEASPAANFCTYNVTVGTSSKASGTKTSSQYSSLSGVNYTFSVTLTGANNSAYNLSINCTDTNGMGTLATVAYQINDSAAPTLTLTSSESGTSTKTVTVSGTTSEAATCRYDDTDAAYGTLSSIMDGAGTTSHSFSNSYTSTTTATYYVRCQDSNSNAMSTSEEITYTVTISSDSTGGGGGGGGGGISLEGTSESYTWSDVKKGTVLRMSIGDVNIPIEEVRFKVKKDMGQIDSTVTELTRKPDSVDTPTLKINAYIDITVSGADDADIESATISFRVPLSWLKENGYAAADVVLLRWSNGAWGSLTTIHTSNDGSYAYFEATTPGFSYFAIAVKGDAVTPPPADTGDETSDDTGEGTSPDATGDVTAPPTDKGDVFPDDGETKGGFPVWIIVLLLVVIFAVLVYFLKAGKNAPTPPSESIVTGTKQEKKSQGANQSSTMQHDEQLTRLDMYIRSSMEMGRNKAEVREILIDAGWQRDIITEALKRH